MGPVDSWFLWDTVVVAVLLRSHKQANIVFTYDFDMDVFLGLNYSTGFPCKFPFSDHNKILFFWFIEIY
jgi:hypothetical protein